MYKCSLKWWFGIWKPVFEDWLCQLAGKFGLSEVFPHRGFSFIRFIFYLQIFIPQGKCHVLTFIPSATLSIWLSVSPSLCIYPSNLCFTVYYISFQKQFLVRRESRWSGWDPTTLFRVFSPHLVCGWPSWFLCANFDSVLKPGVSWQWETMVRRSQQHWLLTPGQGSHLSAWASSSWMERWSILEHIHYGSHISYQFRFQAFVRINSYAPRWISASARAM